jgi:hypothetical protein
VRGAGEDIAPAMSAAATKPETYKPPPPHALPPDAAEFLASLPEVERQLHALAADKLGSSYFMDRTHSYKNWKKKRAAGAGAATK